MEPTAGKELMASKSSKIVFNISGQRFVTTVETLLKHPKTTIGKLAAEHEQYKPGEYFFDADEEVFREVLRFHRTGELHVPRNMCYRTFCKQLKFWNVDVSAIEECCQSEGQDEEADQNFENDFQLFEKRIILSRELTRKDAIWYFLTDPTGPNTRFKTASKGWTIIYCVMVVIQCINNAITTHSKLSQIFLNTTTATFYESTRRMLGDEACSAIKAQREMYANLHAFPVVYSISLICTAFFTVEVLVRFICCPKKLVFISSANALDLVIALLERGQLILMFITYRRLDVQTTENKFCQALNHIQIVLFMIIQMRCVRLLKFATIFRDFQVLLLAVYSSRKEIALLVTTMGISCLICAPILYNLELIGSLSIAESDIPNIDSIPAAYWWVVVTMTTVGYGDYYPVNGLGYTVAAVVMVLGLMLTALPIAIIGANFTIYHEYNRKRNKQKKKVYMCTDTKNESSISNHGNHASTL